MSFLKSDEIHQLGKIGSISIPFSNDPRVFFYLLLDDDKPLFTNLHSKMNHKNYKEMNWGTRSSFDGLCRQLNYSSISDSVVENQNICVLGQCLHVVGRAIYGSKYHVIHKWAFEVKDDILWISYLNGVTLYDTSMNAVKHVTEVEALANKIFYIMKELVTKFSIPKNFKLQLSPNWLKLFPTRRRSTTSNNLNSVTTVAIADVIPVQENIPIAIPIIQQEYDCIFYSSRLGIRLNFLFGDAVVASVETEDEMHSWTNFRTLLKTCPQCVFDTLKIESEKFWTTADRLIIPLPTSITTKMKSSLFHKNHINYPYLHNNRNKDISIEKHNESESFEKGISVSSLTCPKINNPFIITTSNDILGGVESPTEESHDIIDIKENGNIMNISSIKAETYFQDPQVNSVIVSINGVSISGLDGPSVLTIMKQRKRPLIIRFKTGCITSAKKRVKIHFSEFINLYQHPSAARMRARVDKILDEYLRCDWRRVYVDKSGTPQATIVSLYRFIISEMQKLCLFDNKTSQGSGQPNMEEEQWNDVRKHVETFISRQVFSFSKNLGALGFDSMQGNSSHGMDDLQQSFHGGMDLNQGGVQISRFLELSSDPYQLRFASLHFVTLQHLGLLQEKTVNNSSHSGGSEHKRSDSISSADGASTSGGRSERGRSGSTVTSCTTSFGTTDLSVSATDEFGEEWIMAGKELYRALNATSPIEILTRMKTCVRLVGYALQLHMNKLYASTTSTGTGTGVTSKSNAESIVSPVLPVSPGDKSEKKHRTVTLVSDVALEAEKDRRSSNRTFGADELLPAVAWTILRSNINIAELQTALWLASEFHHPDLRMGEETYCVAQISSGLELCRQLSASTLFMDENIFVRGIQKYEYTLTLLLACKIGNLDEVMSCIEAGADVNGLSPDQKDRPLSICIRYNQREAFALLLKHPNIDVNAFLSPIHGIKQDITLLMLAAELGQLEYILLLLKHNANRYIIDEKGSTALTYAIHANHIQIVKVLLAGPLYVNLLNCWCYGDITMLQGLLLQGQSPNTCVAVIQTDTQQTRFDYPLLAAAAAGNDCVVELLLTSGADPNLANDRSETALIRLAQFVAGIYSIETNRNQSTSTKQLLRMDIEERIGQPADKALQKQHKALRSCLLLLAAGANRYLTDKTGKSALTWITFTSIPSCTSNVRENGSDLSGHMGVPIDRDDSDEVVSVYERNRITSVLQYNPATSKLVQLARIGCVEGIRALSDQGLNLNEWDSETGESPLVASVCGGHLNCVLMLIYCADLSNGRPLLIDEVVGDGMTALHHAAVLGRVDIMGVLLRFGANRTPLNVSGSTPLMLIMNKNKEAADCLRYDPSKSSACVAARQGDWAAFSALLRQGVSVNIRTDHPDIVKTQQHELYCPLISAAAYGQIEFLRNLLSETVLSKFRLHTGLEIDSDKRLNEHLEVNINQINSMGQTALMYAASRGDEAMVMLLLQKGANRYIKDVDGKDAAVWAKQRGNELVWDILCADPSKFYIHDAIRNMDMPLVIAFLKQGVDCNQIRLGLCPNQFDVMDVDASNASDAVGYTKPVSSPKSPGNQTNGNRRRGMYYPNVSPNKKTSASNNVVHVHPYSPGETPLGVAAALGLGEIASLLLSVPKIQVDLADATGRTPLFLAAMNGHETLVLMLLRQNASRCARCIGLTGGTQTSLEVSSRAGFDAIANILLADPNEENIHDACEEGKVSLIEALLKQGVSISTRDNRPGKSLQTPLMAAARMKRTEVVRTLLSFAAKNDTTLAVSFSCRSTASSSTSLSNQPDNNPFASSMDRMGLAVVINERDADGRTPLMLAAGAGALEITSLLLRNGCDRNLRDSNGLTAQQHASAHSYMTSMQFIGQNMIR